MSETPKTAKSVAIMFADVCGSTSLYEKLGDAEALAAIEGVLQLARRSVELHQGKVVKTIGDEIMAVLPGADAAMQAACDIQIRLAEHAPVGEVKLAMRIGFHFGPAIEDGSDYFGDAVNVAARMAGKAKAGKVITNDTTRAAMSDLLKKSTRDLDATMLKGKQEEMQIVEVMWDPADDSTGVAAPEMRVPVKDAVLTVRYGDKIITVGAARPRITMGRDPASDLPTLDKMASRLHARIEFSKGKFFLKDESTNGTYLTVVGDEEILLKREQTLLRGSGVFCFGHSVLAEHTAPNEVVSFTVE